MTTHITHADFDALAGGLPRLGRYLTATEGLAFRCVKTWCDHRAHFADEFDGTFGIYERRAEPLAPLCQDNGSLPDRFVAWA